MSPSLHAVVSRNALATLVLLSLLACPGEPHAMGTFQMVTVGLIPYGQGANEIFLADDCEECSGQEACSFFAFAQSDSLIHIYNIGPNTLTSVRLSGHSIASLATAPGPDLDGSQGAIEDGCATADGTIYLVSNSGNTIGGRYRVFMHTPATGQWTGSEPIPDSPEVGWAQVMGQRVQLSGGTRIAEELDSPGTIALYTQDRRGSPAIVVAQNGALLPAASRALLAPGIRTPAGVTALKASPNSALRLARNGGDTTNVNPRRAGSPIGMDSLGNTYSLVIHPEEGTRPDGGYFEYVECFSPSGALLASQSRTGARPLIRDMLGKRFVFAPGARIFDLSAVESGIRIDLWTRGE